jgi:hypothetical protein
MVSSVEDWAQIRSGAPWEDRAHHDDLVFIVVSGDHLTGRDG